MSNPTKNLPSGYSIQELDSTNFWPLVEEKMKAVFSDDLIFYVREVWTDDEKARLKNLADDFKYPYFFHAVMKLKDDIVGWTYGCQDSRESFYMVNSGILPEHRGRGLYTELMTHTLDVLKEKGFQRIWSRHNFDNNEIIIPKLKKGFQITGTELTDIFGALVHLTYFTNPIRKKVMSFRSGHRRPDEEVKKIFGM
jgi:hypothetical protein